VLRYLLEHPGEIVSIDELLDTVWAGRIVEQNAVHRNINRIRRALGDSSRDPIYLETISKRGYRTLAPVKRIEAAPPDSDLQAALAALTPPYPAYDGDEPFVFICYSHQNREPVYEELIRLRSAGINVWYDEGISPGAEWTEEIAHAVSNCEHLLFFASPDSVDSIHCLNELNLAQSREKSIVVVHLEPTQLPAKLELTLGLVQALFKHQMEEMDYNRKIVAALSSSAGRTRGPTRTPTSAAPPDARMPTEEPTGRFRQRAMAAAAMAALVVAISMLVLRGPNVDLFREPAPENSIVVPPFRDLTPKHDAEHLSGTIQSDVRVALPEMGFQVVGSILDSADVTQTANAAYLLTGSVQRGFGSIRVTIELFSTDNDHQIYAKVYDLPGEDAEVVQSQIADQMAVDLARVVGEEQPALLANITDKVPATGTLQSILSQQPALPQFTNFDDSAPAAQIERFNSFENAEDAEPVDDFGGFEDFDSFDTFDEGGSDE
jgi:TolB-like protein